MHARPAHWKASIDGESMSKGERVWPCERRHDAEHVACLHQCTQHYNLISSRRKLRLLTVSSPVCACVCAAEVAVGWFRGPGASVASSRCNCSLPARPKSLLFRKAAYWWHHAMVPGCFGVMVSDVSHISRFGAVGGWTGVPRDVQFYLFALCRVCRPLVRHSPCPTMRQLTCDPTDT